MQDDAAREAAIYRDEEQREVSIRMEPDPSDPNRFTAKMTGDVVEQQKVADKMGMKFIAHNPARRNSDRSKAALRQRRRNKARDKKS